MRSAKAARLFLLLFFASLPVMTGCSNFFIPVCQAYNTCTASTSAPTISSLSPTSGSSGTSVTITGANFTGATAVTFGSTAASSFNVVSSTQITAVAPAGSGTVGVVVTTSVGASNSVSFTYGTAPATASYIYVANQTAGTITGLSLSSGTLAAIPGASYNLGTQPNALATTPNGSLLYLALQQTGSVYVYGVSSKGALTLGNSGQQVTSTYLPTYMTTDRTGNWLFLVSTSSPTLLEFQINPSTGVLVPPPGNPSASITLAGGTPTQVYITPNNQFVFVGLGTAGVEIFAFNPSNGALSSNPLLLKSLNPNTNGDNAISSDANSQFLFVGETGSGVRVFTIGSNGTLKEVAGSPFSMVGAPDAIAMDPTNTYVYVSNHTSNTISGYTLGSTGTLTPLSTSPFTVGTAPIAMSLDASGQYMLVASFGGGPDLQVFSFDTASPGKLDVVTSTATGADPTGPISMAVAP